MFFETNTHKQIVHVDKMRLLYVFPHRAYEEFLLDEENRMENSKFSENQLDMKRDLSVVENEIKFSPRKR